MVRDGGKTGSCGCHDIYVARLARTKEGRQEWLKRALTHRHPEALSILARDAMLTDLPKARALLLEASANGSRSAITLLVNEYLQYDIIVLLSI